MPKPWPDPRDDFEMRWWHYAQAIGAAVIVVLAIMFAARWIAGRIAG